MVDSGRVTDSFGDFVAAALPGLLRFGHVLTGDPREAEDLVQEALARSLRRWRSVRSGDAVPYVRRVMVNTHITRTAVAMTPSCAAAKTGTGCAARLPDCLRGSAQCSSFATTWTCRTRR
jgi:hypothetical protein